MAAEPPPQASSDKVRLLLVPPNGEALADKELGATLLTSLEQGLSGSDELEALLPPRAPTATAAAPNPLREQLGRAQAALARGQSRRAAELLEKAVPLGLTRPGLTVPLLREAYLT